ncbi:MAG: aspartate--tRNA(Asn) ligase [Patescibacteria group bacterium]|nr:aspartate--tRNA(Asn) ligase [Patescibacteria group bacterium]
MERTLIVQTPNFLGKEVRVKGWVNSRRDHGAIVFLDLRDASGLLQVVASSEIAEDITDEYVVEIEGQIKERPRSMVNAALSTGQVELEAKTIKVISKAEVLPFDLKEIEKVSLPVLLDFRPLSLRHEKIKAIFKVEEAVIESFRAFLKNRGFTEIQVPTIVPTATEGGSEVFKVDYYGKNAFLAQSPQFYKQIMAGVFEKVYTLAHLYRAEPSVTTRHMSEFLGMDAEMGFIESWEEIMETADAVIKNIFKTLEQKCPAQLTLLNATMPLVTDKTPRLKMREAQEIIFQRTGRDNRAEPDLSPQDEREICQWAKETGNSDIIFITHYPTKKRPFYTQEDPNDPEYTLSFDVLCRGLEIVTGGQRINDYQKLLNNVKKWGNKPENFDLYLQAFKYGMPPEGGFCLGAERIVKQILGLENLREASLFPRDMSRIDFRLSREE